MTRRRPGVEAAVVFDHAVDAFDWVTAGVLGCPLRGSVGVALVVVELVDLEGDHAVITDDTPRLSGGGRVSPPTRREKDNGYCGTVWETVPSLDTHYYDDNIAENDPIGSSPQARDAEAELLAAVIYPATSRQFTRNRMAVRRDLLGQWTSDGHTPFSEDEITELRRAAFHVALSDTEVRQLLKNRFAEK